MRYRITFVAGLAVGYVLGAKAGKARYEQIVRLARSVVDSPAVQETAGVVGAQVAGAGKAAYHRISDRLPVTSLKDFLARPTEEEADELDPTVVEGMPTSGSSDNRLNGAGPDSPGKDR
ncbi:hypothetical protein LG943_06955 [Streptomonospora sp. S1-112]|uniref:Uncharacterized protein n=1 Tax=Streptomonospora mangrovi TaxID=2883123 RepID=A0A9X3NU04_9ACTN|nr:hypothetical protein [Streptomonospora mangrovi]MDA0564066.1 hypothetical protein [Streptomonospora mangrovi]